jgi:hypothetical protein
MTAYGCTTLLVVTLLPNYPLHRHLIPLHSLPRAREALRSDGGVLHILHTEPKRPRFLVHVETVGLRSYDEQCRRTLPSRPRLIAASFLLAMSGSGLSDPIPNATNG